jgi:hypothetical protein
MPLIRRVGPSIFCGGCSGLLIMRGNLRRDGGLYIKCTNAGCDRQGKKFYLPVEYIDVIESNEAEQATNATVSPQTEAVFESRRTPAIGG